MKKTYKIEIDCANCANKVETAINAMDSVTKATVNFMTQKMIVEYAEGVDPAVCIKEIEKVGKKVEEDFEIEM